MHFYALYHTVKHHPSGKSAKYVIKVVFGTLFQINGDCIPDFEECKDKVDCCNGMCMPVTPMSSMCFPI